MLLFTHGIDFNTSEIKHRQFLNQQRIVFSLCVCVVCMFILSYI